MDAFSSIHTDDHGAINDQHKRTRDGLIFLVVRGTNIRCAGPTDPV